MTLAKLGYLSIIKSENGRRIQICQPNNYLMMLDMFEQQAIKEIKEKLRKKLTIKLHIVYERGLICQHMKD